MEGLRGELLQDTAPRPIDMAAAPLTKVEQMLAEVTKARESLHDDTARLEAMLAQGARETAARAEPAEDENAAAQGPGGAGKPAKNPLDVLAKAMRGIKPEQAAPIVTRLDKHLAASVLQRMPPADAGKILAAMKPETAAELATQISARLPAAGAKR